MRCIPCGAGMTYSTTLSACQCTASSKYSFNGDCYTSTTSWTATQSTSSPDDYLAEQHVHL